MNDHLGNTRVVLDEDGDVKEFYDYYPFGMTMRDNVTGSEKARVTFTGKEEDQEQGLNWHYFGARYYDAEIGRWLGVDPLAGKYPSVSPYVYALNNPIILIDPNGMDVRGDSASVEAGAALVNQALKDKNIANASARRDKKVVKRGFWEKLSSLDFSDTKVVHFLKLEGVGWGALNANDPKLTVEQNEMATQALSMLKDLVDMTDVMTFNWTDTGPKGVSLSEEYSGGISKYPNVYVSPEGNKKILSSGWKGPRYGEPIVGIFFHELVGHNHPNSFRASIMNVIFGYGSENPHKKSGLTFTWYNKAPIGR